jgi:hypothetical protein
MVGLGDDERLRSFAGRVAHRAELDAAVAAFIAERTLDEVLTAFDAADAAVAPIYSMADVAEDPTSSSGTRPSPSTASLCRGYSPGSRRPRAGSAGRAGTSGVDRPGRGSAGLEPGP